jgi:transposase InsO family protein
MNRSTKHVGLDVHQATTVSTIRDDGGHVLARRVLPTEATALVEYLRGLRGTVHVAFEEGTQAQWLHDLLVPIVHRVVVCNRRGQSTATYPGVVSPTTHAPNDLWTADFKGEFRTGDDEYCYPFTVADLHTRYLLACTGLRSTRTHGAQQVFEQLLREHGVPRAIRTDSGVPFATSGLHGLSSLSVWWIRLGIQHQRIQPASPQQNGAHERMHKTLKRGATRPPRANLQAQQRAFNQFRALYNDERPHEALNGNTPSSRYRPSARSYPVLLPPIDYPGHFEIRAITAAGTFRFGEKLFFLSNSLKHLPVGLEEIDDGVWSVYFCHVLLTRLNERTQTLIRG